MRVRGWRLEDWGHDLANQLVDTAKGVLEPYVGSMAADTCLRATAISAGKSADELTTDDWPTIDASIRRLLSPIAPSNTIDQILAEIHGGVR